MDALFVTDKQTNSRAASKQCFNANFRVPFCIKREDEEDEYK